MYEYIRIALLPLVVCLPLISLQAKERSPIYDFTSDDNYKHEIIYGEPGAQVKAEFKVHVESELDQTTTPEKRSGLPRWQTAPYYQVTCELSSLEADFEERKDSEQKLNSAFADMKEFSFQIEINEHGHIRDTDLATQLENYQDAREGGVVLSSPIRNMLALTFEYLWPCLVKEERFRAASQHKRNWEELGVSMLAKKQPSASAIRTHLNIARKTPQSARPETNVGTIYWCKEEYWKELKRFGHSRDRKINIFRRMWYNRKTKIFQEAEVEREMVVVEGKDPWGEPMKSFFKSKALDIDATEANSDEERDWQPVEEPSEK